MGELRKPLHYFENLIKDNYGFSAEQYDFFLAQDIDSKKEVAKRIELYSLIEELCIKLGHLIFIPHRFTKFPGESGELCPEDTYDLLNGFMIPKSKLILCDLGINSTSVGTMMAKATFDKKPAIYFYERKTTPETEREAAYAIGFAQNFQKQKSIAIVRFDTIKECIEGLELEIKKWEIEKNYKSN